MYTTTMATLQKRKVKGHNYWYIVESKRVNGKPRPIVLAYLGRTEQLLEKLTAAREGQIKVTSFSYGGVFILWNFIKKLQIIELFNKYISHGQKGKTTKRNGLSPGEGLALVILQRALEPDSKRAFHAWIKKTALPQMLGFKPEKLTSQYFWDIMDLLKEEHIEKIEEQITEKIVAEYSIELATVLYDTTNFFTFISTENNRSMIPKRGHNKQHRNDLRQFSLSLLVSKDYQIPLLSQVYEGNRNDAEIFPESMTLIRKRLEKLAGDVTDITLVFDKGNNSKKAFNTIDHTAIHYIASLSVYHDKELLGIPAEEFSVMRFEDEPGKILRVYRTKKYIWGKERTALMFISHKLKNGQIRGIERELCRAYKNLESLNKSLLNPKNRKKRTLESVKEQTKKIAGGQYIKDILATKVVKSKGYFRVEYSLDTERYEELKEKVLGKRILITDRHDWTNEDIIENYHGQSRIESVFRQIKNPFHTCVRPQFHWTDQKIKVHTFCCLLSYLVCALLRKKAREDGIEISIDEMLEKLQNIREARIVRFAKDEKLQITTQLEEIEEEERMLFYSLKNWCIQS